MSNYKVKKKYDRLCYVFYNYNENALSMIHNNLFHKTFKKKKSLYLILLFNILNLYF